MTITLHPSLAVHPGEWLKTEIIEPHRLTVVATAKMLGVTRQSMSNLLNGHGGVSAEMAIRFEKSFGLRADTLLRMQMAFDLATARAKDIQVQGIIAAVQA